MKGFFLNNLNYGVIGNCTTAALVSENGTMEWLCFPFFDSSSVFASLLDKNKGGEFAIFSDDTLSITQNYMRNTNILSTVVKTSSGEYEIVDFMPRYLHDLKSYHCPPDVIRYIRLRSGSPTIRVKYNPQLNYAEGETRTTVKKKYIKSTNRTDGYESVYLYSNCDLEKIASGEPVTLKNNVFFLLGYNQKLSVLNDDYINLEYQKTKAYWMGWVARSRFSVSAYSDQIVRSLLVLKLLAFQQTGALLAAVTTSLPESIKDVRNWDYRYCWIRDASMGISVLARLGHENVSRRYMEFILDVIPFKDEKIQIMYGINGEKKLEEHILEHLDGYEGSKPVRIGNAAYKQKQNDIYGVLLDIIHYSIHTFPSTIDVKEKLWTVVRSLSKTVSYSWRHKDRGIWEYRSVKQHFTFSKLLCWLAMDRSASIAESFDEPHYAAKWRNIRNEIKQDILKYGWNDKIGSFTQYYGSDYLDASNLLMEKYGFINADDPRYILTVQKTDEHLSRNGLTYRYRNDDDFGTPDSTFTLCSFWMISALFKIGQKDEAYRRFENLISYMNHLGLLSEDIDVKTGRLLGNFPQAYSHLGLIDTAVLLYSDQGDQQEQENIYVKKMELAE